MENTMKAAPNMPMSHLYVQGMVYTSITLAALPKGSKNIHVIYLSKAEVLSFD